MKSQNWNCLGWKGLLRLSGPLPTISRETHSSVSAQRTSA